MEMPCIIVSGRWKANNDSGRQVLQQVLRSTVAATGKDGKPYFRPGIMPFMERIIFIMPPPDSFFIMVCICSN